jgi:hypothetical protein
VKTVAGGRNSLEIRAARRDNGICGDQLPSRPSATVDRLESNCHLRMDKFIHIRSPKFAILPGEEEELVNEGMYGKAVAEYLQARLKMCGYDAPFYCCEDWGWWVELKDAPFTFGVCIYCSPERDGLLDFFCTDGAAGPRKWSWRSFRFIDTGPWVERLHEDLAAIFRGDPEVQLVRTDLDSPFPEEGNGEPDRGGNR